MTSSSSALAPILSSADTCDASYISRLSHKTQLATDRVTSAISGLIGEVTSAVGTVGRGVAKRQSRAEKALEMFSDELESCIKTLEGIHAQLTSAVDSNIVGVEGLYDITASLTTAASLVADTHQLPTASCALILGCVDVADALSSVHNQLSRVQLDVDPNRCVVSIPDGLRMKASAIVTVPFLDCEGDTISGVWLEDVTVMSPWSVGAPSLIGNMLSIPISVGADGKNTTALRVDIMTQAVEATIEVN